MGFTGGMNIGDPWSYQQYEEDAWRDTQIQLTGPAAHDLDLLFLNGTRFEGQPGEDSTQAVDGGFLVDVGELPPYSVTPLPASLPASEISGFASATPSRCRPSINRSPRCRNVRDVR